MREKITVKCAKCFKEKLVIPCRTKDRKNHFCDSVCQRRFFKEHPPRKANGYWYENGYKVLYNKGNYIKEHIYFAEMLLGRKLKKNEIVHHKNGKRDDNRIENLEVMDRSEHTSHHQKCVPEKRCKWWAERPKRLGGPEVNYLVVK